MGFKAKLREELKSLGSTTLFFAAWFGVLILLKWLILAEYSIEMQNVSIALIGALIVAKVVLVLEKVPLETWAGARSGLAHVTLRTFLYGVSVLALLILEKAFEARHEFGGFGSSLVRVFHHQDIPHVVAASIGVTSGLLVFNAMSVVRRHLGARGLLALFLAPLPEQTRRESV